MTVVMDGVKTQEVVLFGGTAQFRYEVALGRVSAGQHEVELVLGDRMTPPAAGPVNVSNHRPATTAAGDLVARHAPILYGRDVPEVAGRGENARTDVPLLSYALTTPNADGTRTIEYTVIWSNEAGRSSVTAAPPRRSSSRRARRPTTSRRSRPSSCPPPRAPGPC